MSQRSVRLLSVAGFSLLAGLGLVRIAWRTVPAPPPAPLPAYGSLPAFSLTDQHGRSVTRQDLAGHVWIADFIFTSCPGQCPLMTEQLRALQRTVPPTDDVQFVSFTVDPSHDTPHVLADYAHRYGGDGRWRLLTGPHNALRTLCLDGFHLGIEETPSAAEPIVHSVRFVLIDRGGTIRGYYDATDSRQMGRLHRDVRQLLRDRG